MIYEYECNACGTQYTRSNKIEHRKKGGRCTECCSSDTRMILSTPMFRTCGTGHGKGWNGKGVVK